MASIFADFKQGYVDGSGYQLAAALSPIAPPEDPDRFFSFYDYFSNKQSLRADLQFSLFKAQGLKLPKQEQNVWVDIFLSFWKVVGELVKFDESPDRASWVNTFDAWKELSNTLMRGYSSGVLHAWTVPCLYVVGKYLRAFAIRADMELTSESFGNRFQDDVLDDFAKNEKLEDAARIINRMFTLCLSDRAPIEESRKWGVYNMTNLLFKTYFRLNSVGLSRNVLNAIEASSADMPPMEAFPKAHIVTFKYYVGVIHFLDENYREAEKHLTYALEMCHRAAVQNRELILTYLVPCHIVTAHTLPSKAFLSSLPRLEKLFRPLCECIKKGDLVGFDAAMLAGEDEFVKRRIYLPLERGRDLALRNLFRKVFIAGGFDESNDGQPPIRRTRVPVREFAAALRIGTHAEGNSRVDMDEVECLLSNLIYKGLIKGYISRERGMVVLSKNGTAFPGTGI